MICKLIFLHFNIFNFTLNLINIHDFPTPLFPINNTLNK